MTDREIVDGLIARDEQTTEQFFFKNCRPLFVSIIRHVFSYEVDYDELVSEFYLYLMENNAYRLCQYQGKSTIYQWMKVVAIRFFIAKRNNVIEDESKEALLECGSSRVSTEGEAKMVARMDLEYLFAKMGNQRYVYAIRRLILEDAEPTIVARELNTNVDNLYNIKRRAIAALTEVALNDVEKYEKGGRK